MLACLPALFTYIARLILETVRPFAVFDTTYLRQQAAQRSDAMTCCDILRLILNHCSGAATWVVYVCGPVTGGLQSAVVSPYAMPKQSVETSSLHKVLKQKSYWQHLNQGLGIRLSLAVNMQYSSAVQVAHCRRIWM